MRKRILALITILVCLFSFTGCNKYRIETDVTKLMNPPTLSEEQAEIYALLEEHVSSKLRLKYPNKGEHRSAFIFKDLDGDGEDEVVAFFEFKEMGKPQARISLLAKDDNGWYFVKDIPGGGIDVEDVSFETFKDDTTHMLVGYSESGKKSSS